MRPATIGTVTSSSGQIQSSLRSHVSLNVLLSVLCGASVMLVGILLPKSRGSQEQRHTNPKDLGCVDLRFLIYDLRLES